MRRIYVRNNNIFARRMSNVNEADATMEVDASASSSKPETSNSALNVPNFIETSEISTGKGVMATAGTVPSVTVSLHPLVIMNVSEHWTRRRAQEGSPQKIIGALIGKQKGRNIEVMNSFELLFSIVDEDFVIDREYYKTKEEQFKQVFSDMDFLGWYTTCEAPTERDLRVHKQICEINECPIMLQCNPLSRNMDQLPISIFESIIDLVGGEAAMLFVPLTYTLATEEAERIGVDHVARMSSNEAGENSLVAEHLTAQHSAIKMLHSRIKIVLEFMKEVESGKRQASHDILRETYSLSHRLPVLQSELFRHEFYNQCNDVGLVTYLGAITKGTNDINQLVNKFNMLYDRQAMGRRMRGLFF